MTETLIGVGALLAIDPDNPAGDLPAIAVRVGGADLWLASGDDYRVWGTLSRAPQTLEALAQSFFVTGEGGDRQPVTAAEVADVVDGLLDQGLVVGIQDGDPHFDLAMRLRLQPLWRAVTTELADRDRFPIGTATGAQVLLNKAQHDVWASLDGRNRVADIAVGIALRSGIEESQPDLADAWQRCVELVRMGAAYVDLALA